ncbi:MgtC/SapB family protein [Paenibacillus sp. WQ 127069]|uniref:MgtC/SapB family protein n=2 Tax=Paenibacillus baimaensis TaxID=2982185 RepID=A0ABT2UEG2_9BACL|nr:MgtC/SapB family protein [Paenibacillus sp. WQ 127069]MCU6793038.1 MgtC/SapB family protein [Paenibacillus sp. WQ 127069]
MQYEYLLRVILAGICGALVGYERKNRMKEAGIRTHFVVALGASLMMIISKYGFQDQNGWENVAFDPSRIAAQVVSGVGFLGAGMIFMQRLTIKGLTTAAGIWATAGVGMAIGAGLYVLGAGVAIIIFVAQKLLHGRFNWLSSPKTEQLVIRITNEPGATSQIQQLLEEKHISILSFQAESSGISSEDITLEMIVRFPGSYGVEQLLPIVQEASFVRAVELK